MDKLQKSFLTGLSNLRQLLPYVLWGINKAFLAKYITFELLIAYKIYKRNAVF